MVVQIMIIVAIVVSVVAAIALAIWSKDKKGVFVNTTRQALGMKPPKKKTSWFRRLRSDKKTPDPPVVQDPVRNAPPPAATTAAATAAAAAPNTAVLNAMHEQFAEVLQDRRETINNLAKEVEDKHVAVVKLERYRDTCQKVKDAYTDMREEHQNALEDLKRSLEAIRKFVRERPEWDHTLSLEPDAHKDLKLALDKYTSDDRTMSVFVKNFKTDALKSRAKTIAWINLTRVEIETIRNSVENALRRLEDLHDRPAEAKNVAKALHSIIDVDLYALHRIYEESSETRPVLKMFGIGQGVEAPSEYKRRVGELMRDVSLRVSRLVDVDKDVATSYDNCMALMRENQIDGCVALERPARITTDDLRQLLDCASASISPSAPAPFTNRPRMSTVPLLPSHSIHPPGIAESGPSHRAM